MALRQRRRGSILVLSTVWVALSALGASPEDEVFDFAKRLSDGTIQTQDPNYVRFGVFEIAGDTRNGLYTHPTTSIEFPSIEVKEDSVLVFGFGILPGAWDQPGDGVEFRVTMRTSSGRVVTLFDQYIDPKHNSEQRRWSDVRLKLWPFAGTFVKFTFETFPGPKDNIGWDWAVWGAPRIVAIR